MKKFLTILTVLLILMFSMAEATDYYVDQDGYFGTVGDNANDGLAWSSPWLTPEYATTTVTSGHHTIYIAPGRYRLTDSWNTFTGDGNSAAEPIRVIFVEVEREQGDSLIIDKAIISGGAVITGWTKQGDQDYYGAACNYQPWKVFYNDIPLDTAVSKAQLALEDSAFYDNGVDSVFIRTKNDVSPDSYIIDAPYIGARLMYPSGGVDYWEFIGGVFEKCRTNDMIDARGNVTFIRCIFRWSYKSNIYSFPASSADTVRIYYCSANGGAVNATSDGAFKVNTPNGPTYVYNNFAFNQWSWGYLYYGGVAANVICGYNFAWGGINYPGEFSTAWQAASEGGDADLDTVAVPQFYSYPNLLIPFPDAYLCENAIRLLNYSTEEGEYGSTTAGPYSQVADTIAFGVMKQSIKKYYDNRGW